MLAFLIDSLVIIALMVAMKKTEAKRRASLVPAPIKVMRNRR